MSNQTAIRQTETEEGPDREERKRIRECAGSIMSFLSNTRQ